MTAQSKPGSHAFQGVVDHADPAIALDGSDLDYLDEQQVVGDPHLE